MQVPVDVDDGEKEDQFSIGEDVGSPIQQFETIKFSITVEYAINNDAQHKYLEKL